VERRGGDFPASKVAARYEAQPDDQKTVHYYLGGKEVAFKRGDTLYYVHQDHLGSSAVITNSASALVESMAYYPYGGTRTGSIATTEEQFTGQRLDSTGLYYYNARYYDPSIGRFISADTFGAKLGNPQSLNRYSYVLNNPLRYVDPSGHCALEDIDGTCPGASGKSASPGTTPSPDVPAPSAPVESAPSPTDNRLVAFGVGATVVLAADNVTGVGVVDDLLIPAIWLGIAVYSGVQAGKAIVSLTSESSSNDASGASQQADGGTAQKGGNTVRGSTAEKLNDYNGESRTAREWGRALEDLKHDKGVPKGDHGTIKRNGDYYDTKGNKVGNIGEYLP